MKISILEPLAVSEEKLRSMSEYITNQGHELVIYDSISEDDRELIKRVEDTDIAIIANSPFRREVIESAKKLKMLTVAFTGVDHVDMEACRERDILVSNAAGYSTNSVAELVYGMIISLYRNLVPLDEITREGGTKSGYRQRDVKGKVLGVIGTGEIGIDVAKLGKAFGCEVLAYNRSKKQELIDLGVEYLELEELLSRSDIVSIHLPFTKETEGIIGKKELKLMGSEAILINAARGPIVNIPELTDALNKGVIAGAGIDVFDIEPPLEKDYPILSAKNTVLAPHIGFATEEAMIRRAEITFDNVDSWLNNKPKNIVK